MITRCIKERSWIIEKVTLGIYNCESSNIIKSKLNLKNTNKKISFNKPNIPINNKYIVPTVRDWKNSIYVYNKNALSLIPVASRLVMKLINGYFSSYNLKIESKIRKK